MLNISFNNGMKLLYFVVGLSVWWFHMISSDTIDVSESGFLKLMLSLTQNENTNFTLLGNQVLTPGIGSRCGCTRGWLILSAPRTSSSRSPRSPSSPVSRWKWPSVTNRMLLPLASFICLQVWRDTSMGKHDFLWLGSLYRGSEYLLSKLSSSIFIALVCVGLDIYTSL